MKRPFSLLLAVLALAIYPSCESTNPYDQTVFRLEEGPRSGASGNRYGYRGDGSDQAGDRRARRTIGRGDSPVAATTDRGETRVLRNDNGPAVRDEVANDFSDGSSDVASNNPAADDKPAPDGSGGDDKPETLKPDSSAGDKPFADPVAGKYGHVISPFAPGREVDVTGFPPGTEVRCPYTQKIFRVP